MPPKRTLNKRQLAKLLLTLGLCYLLYLFSYDYGRAALAPELKRLKAELGRQRNENDRLLAEVEHLRKLLAEAPSPEASSERDQAPPAVPRSINLRTDTSEMLFDHQLSLVLLEHSQLDSNAVIQFNFLQEGRVTRQKIPLGGAFRFQLAEREKLLILEELRPGSVVVKIVNL